jgi:hypothetical protein
MPVADDVPLHRVRRPKISNERNRGEGTRRVRHTL